MLNHDHRIHALPLKLANQIAAGEVIERPASVLKELVENSIDAGATQITINTEGAGSQLISVCDNGSGIHPDDLSLALSRHATSKLHSSQQLSQIASLGFRGEALPSIASISDLTLSSRRDDSECAWQLSPNSDKITPSAHPLGTTVEVRNLFFNVPARRHFLRGNKTEQHHLTTTFYRLALSHFEVGFQYQPANSSSIKLPIADTVEKKQQRITKICGKAFISNSLYIDQHYDNIEFYGWVGSLEAHRPQTDIHYFFINGRVIRDRVINHAIRQAYAELIPAGRYPAFVLYLTIPLDQLDINVHPTKHEVRFRDARLIHGLITRALQDVLTSEQPPLAHNADLLQHEEQSLEQVAEQAQHYQIQHSAPANKIDGFGTIIGLLHQRYLITESKQGALLLDLQRAEQAIRQQQIIEAITTDSLRSRPILVPIQIMLEPHHLQLFIQHQETLTTLGINVENHDDHVTIKSIPSLLSHVDIKQLISALTLALESDKTSLKQLSSILQQQCPLIAVHNLQQVEEILKQVPSPDKTQKWCHMISHQSLGELFLP